MDFETAQKIVNVELDKYPFGESPAELYEPVRYILALGGKRLRPSMTLMACSLFSEAVHAAIKPALAFEVFHNFTLLHDDLMDRAEIRRGNKTVHEKWDADRAILSGDVMSILSYRILSESEDRHLKELFRLFNETALQVCEGQQWDMNFEPLKEVTVEEYLKMIELKTAVLLAACLKAGAITGGAVELEADLLYEFGRHLGLAFQVWDDYLDVYGNPDKFGKRIGSDILANKKTFLLVKALEQSGGKMKKELISWLTRADFDPGIKVKKITEIFTALQLDRIAREFTSDHYDKALQYLERVGVPADRKVPLRELAGDLMTREK